MYRMWPCQDMDDKMNRPLPYPQGCHETIPVAGHAQSKAEQTQAETTMYNIPLGLVVICTDIDIQCELLQGFHTAYGKVGKI